MCCLCRFRGARHRCSPRFMSRWAADISGIQLKPRSIASANGAPSRIQISKKRERERGSGAGPTSPAAAKYRAKVLSCMLPFLWATTVGTRPRQLAACPFYLRPL